MNDDPSRSDLGEGDAPAPAPRRLFLLEPGWRVAQKVGSSREFCYMTAPGQDYYHRVYDGEIILLRGDERLCMACAERRGVLAFTPKALREVQSDGAIALENPTAPIPIEFDLELELDLERERQAKDRSEPQADDFA